jgi:putative tricarboxylic transport membrane protein
MKAVFSLRSVDLLIALSFVAVSLSAPAQDWKPERPVEMVIGCAPGCGPDNMARLMQRVFQVNRYFDQPFNIQNKAGGSGVVARTYLNQFEGNGHYLYHADGRGLLIARAMGRGMQTDVTPVAILFGEYIGIAVKADSPIKSGRDLIDRLKKDPAAHSFGLAAGGVGSTNHQGVAGALKQAGIDVRKTRNVVFQSGAQAITALLGGHVDVVPVSLGLWTSHMQSGAVRVIAVSSAERLPGVFSVIPTWREQGANSVVSNWRALFGPRGMTPPQVAFWEDVFRHLVETPEWKAEMVKVNGITRFMGAAPMKKYMEEEYPEIRALLIDLELAKQ